MGISQIKQLKGLSLPPTNHRWLRLSALGLVFACLFSFLPAILSNARIMDDLAAQRVAMWDDTDYQMIAVNVLHRYGFTVTPHMPYEEYKTMRDESKLVPDYQFYRAPGFPILLTGLYAITGVSTLAARIMVGVILWLTAVLLVWIGDRLAGWVGSLAGGLAGYFLFKVSLLVNGTEGYFKGRTLSEPLTAFLITLFALLCIFYLQKRRRLYLYLACLTLTSVALTRANFLAALPIFLVLVFIETRQWKPVLISAVLLFLPVLAWSGYASYTRQSPVLLTTQGSIDFPRFNNQDVITGFGPEK
ncbi:MAG TPA: hypothetical protein VN363_09755, partial [Anaerolineales bacterium]|nr:hypothetical protein [Anaerolineales bacterium]